MEVTTLPPACGRCSEIGHTSDDHRPVVVRKAKRDHFEDTCQDWEDEGDREWTSRQESWAR